jgi:hypothetical protein
VTASATQQPKRLSPTELAAFLALVQAQSAVRDRITRTAVAGAVAAFRSLTPGGWWNPDDLNKAISRALRIVQPAQLQAARTTDAFMTRVASQMTGRAGRPAGVVDITRLRRAIPEQVARDLADGRHKPAFVVLGDTATRTPADRVQDRVKLAVRDHPQQAFVNPADVYGRVADQYRSDVVTKGLPEEKARGKALVRVSAAAQTDVTLAVREQYHRDLTRPESERRRATGWRRILHPELSKTGPCGLCVVAADRVYHTDQLKEIHSGCCCEVLPVYGSFDPGLRLNLDDLDRLYGAAGGTGGNPRRQEGRLKDVRVALAEHAELGPVLVDADQHYRGPVEVARKQLGRTEPADSRRHQLAVLEKTVEGLRERAARGEDVSRPLAWQENRIRELRDSLGPVPA